MQDLNKARDLLRLLLPDVELTDGTLDMLTTKYQGQLESVIKRAQNAAEGKILVLEALPQLQELDLEKFTTEVMKTCYHEDRGPWGLDDPHQVLSEFWVLIIDTNGAISFIEYNDTDYSDGKIKKGFTVFSHRNPSALDDYDYLFPEDKMDKWDIINDRDPRFAEQVGVALVQNINRITNIDPANVPTLLAQIPPTAVQLAS